MVLCLAANGFCAGTEDDLQVNVLGGRDAVVNTAAGRAADIRIQVVDRTANPFRALLFPLSCQVWAPVGISEVERRSLRERPIPKAQSSSPVLSSQRQRKLHHAHSRA